MNYPYHRESLRPALILFVIVIAIVAILPRPELRLPGATFIAGPLAFAALQALRRGRGVTIHPDQIRLQICLTRRTIAIPIAQIQGWRLDSRDQLAIAYHQDRPHEPGDSTTEPRPPRLRYVVSAPLDNPVAISAALPPLQSLTIAQMKTLATMRRIRRVLFWGGALFIGAPSAIVIVLRVFAAGSSLLRVN